MLNDIKTTTIVSTCWSGNVGRPKTIISQNKQLKVTSVWLREALWDPRPHCACSFECLANVYRTIPPKSTIFSPLCRVRSQAAVTKGNYLLNQLLRYQARPQRTRETGVPSHSPPLPFLSSLLLSSLTRRRVYPQRSFGQAVVTGVVQSPPWYVALFFVVHRVQRSHCSSIFIECSLLTLSRFPLIISLCKKSPYEHALGEA